MEQLPKPTLQLIADKAGVSKMTVSRILRNYPNHDSKTRERVLKVAEELHYKRNPLIAALMVNLRHKKPTQFQATIALIHGNPIGHPVHPNRVTLGNGIRESATRHGFDVEGFHINKPGMTPERLSQILENRGFRCIIFEHFTKANVRLDIRLENFACVSITNSLVHPQFDFVDNDHHAGLLLAIEKLKEKGYERFGFITSQQSETIHKNRRLGAFLVSQLSLPKQERIPPFWIKQSEQQFKGGLKRWLDRFKPDAILTAHHEVPQLLGELGYSIPDDVGFLNLALSDNTGNVAGINQNWHEIGALAANHVIELAISNQFGAPNRARTIFTQPYWVDGATLPQKLGSTLEVA